MEKSRPYSVKEGVHKKGFWLGKLQNWNVALKILICVRHIMERWEDNEEKHSNESRKEGRRQWLRGSSDDRAGSWILSHNLPRHSLTSLCLDPWLHLITYIYRFRFFLWSLIYSNECNFELLVGSSYVGLGPQNCLCNYRIYTCHFKHIELMIKLFIIVKLNEGCYTPNVESYRQMFWPHLISLTAKDVLTLWWKSHVDMD